MSPVSYNSRAASLPELRVAFESRYAAFQDTLARKYPHIAGIDAYHWHRACAAVRGDNVRRNDDDTSHDAALAADAELRELWDSYISALRKFYLARDGAQGFLGSRGL